MSTPLRMLLPLAGVCLSILACSSSTEPAGNKNPTDTTKHDTNHRRPPGSLQGPAMIRPYDTALGGVQITAIYFDQGLNDSTFGKPNEWIIFESDRNLSTEGWTFDAEPGNPALQRYPLPDSIFKTLTVYTHEQAGTDGRMSYSLPLSLGKWIWNNQGDTAYLFNRNGTIVDTLSYVVK